MDKNNIKSSDTPVSLTEHLSALLDDEAGSFEQRRVLDELKLNDELPQKLSSYALIGEVMRNTCTMPTVSSASFLTGIHEQIELDETYNRVKVKKTASNSSWLRPAGGFALAASVAAVAVIGFQNFQFGSSVNDASVATLVKDNNLLREKVAAMSVVSTPQARPVSDSSLSSEVNVSEQYLPADARTREFLRTYIDSHLQYASYSALVPSVRVISYTN